MLHRSNFTKLFIIVTLIIASVTFAQGKSMHMDMKCMKTEKHSADSNIVRTGIIDLKAIDKNNDGKVFQCPMDLNVLSDEKKDCPECGMKLREIKIDDAKAKLIKKGFKLSEAEQDISPMSPNQKTETVKVVWNLVCPVTGEDVDSEATTVEYKGKTIGFCCSSCEKKFLKDPEAYMKNLSEDGSKYLK